MFGSFVPEDRAVDYGLTKNIETYNPVRVAWHEFAAIARDVRRADSWRERCLMCSDGRAGRPRRAGRGVGVRGARGGSSRRCAARRRSRGASRAASCRSPTVSLTLSTVFSAAAIPTTTPPPKASSVSTRRK